MSSRHGTVGALVCRRLGQKGQKRTTLSAALSELELGQVPVSSTTKIAVVQFSNEWQSGKHNKMHYGGLANAGLLSPSAYLIFQHQYVISFAKPCG
jgi:hypothetical protein